jgi:hypothetical protein
MNAAKYYWTLAKHSGKIMHDKYREKKENQKPECG